MRRVLLIGFAVVGLGAAAACTPIKAPPPDPEIIEVPFEFTGAPEAWDVPTGVDEITVTAYGAAGGRGFATATSFDGAVQHAEHGAGANGGLGGAATATLLVTPGQLLQVNVGGAGGNATESVVGSAGFNGGAMGRANFCVSLTQEAAGSLSGGGGGASDIRAGAFALADRLVVAGGGGGGGSPYAYGEDGATDAAVTNGGGGGGGGGSNGADGGGALPGGAGTQTGGGLGGSALAEPGALGAGGLGDNAVFCDLIVAATRAGGGGGGGFFGGGGGGAGSFDPVDPPLFNEAGGGGGGGGSGFPADAEFLTGINAGDGRVVISYVAP